MKQFIISLAMIGATPAFADKTPIKPAVEETITVAECESIQNRDKINLLMLRLAELEQLVAEYENLVVTE